MEKRYQVFVSSTYADLKDERRKVIQTLMELDCIPAGMELFPAADEEQLEFIKKIIDDCDYYLLIIGGRYGAVTANGISFTEQEYEYALSVGLKVIALLHENPTQIPFSKSEQDLDNRIRLQEFRDKVASGRLVKFWKEANELPGIVALSLSKTIKTHPAIGWVRADKISREELLSEVNELRKANAELSKALSELEPSIFTKSEEKDCAFIHNKLDRLESVYFKATNKETKAEDIEEFSINLGTLLPFISSSTVHEYNQRNILDLILNKVSNNYDKEKYWLSVSGIEDFADELKMFGFLDKSYVPPSSENGVLSSVLRRGDRFKLIFSEKMERYKYWLSVTGKMPAHIAIARVGPISEA